jgi:hypothetical protein
VPPSLDAAAGTSQSFVALLATVFVTAFVAVSTSRDLLALYRDRVRQAPQAIDRLDKARESFNRAFVLGADPETDPGSLWARL